ncbi:DUF58 domain-containing protein [Wukongibacter baidiensis]|uniref:DUF58 domain-containing protein n=1 Tax=Wukongibacter baidiensis TaxID=1723361 RepID=UPI003D7F5838
MVFTKRFIFVLGLGILFVGLSYFVGLHLTAFIVYNLVCFTVLILDYYISPSSEEFEIERIGEDKLSIYEREKIKLKVYNKSDRRIYMELKDEIPDFHFESHEKIMRDYIDPHEKQDFEYEVIPKKRGVFKFGNIHIRYESNLKLCMKQFKVVMDREYKVYPNLKDLKKYRLAVYNSKFSKVGEKSMKTPGGGTQFESLRDYVQGDEYRKINWKATARENRPIVNQYEPEKNQHVYVLIDIGRPMSYSVRGYKKLDLAINTGLLLSDIVNQNGDRSGLMLFNTEVNNLIMPGKGNHHRNRLMEALYHAQHTNDTSNYEEAFYHLKRKERRRSLMVLFTDFDTIEEAEEMIKVLSVLSKNNIVMLVLMKDEKLENIASASAEKENEIFTKGVAIETLRERKKIIHKLNSKGIMCIECTPEKLAMNVINRYLHVKNRML